MTNNNTEIRATIEKLDFCYVSKVILNALADGDVVHVTNILADYDEDYEFTPDRLEDAPFDYMMWVKSFGFAQHERNMELRHVGKSCTEQDEPCTVLLFTQNEQ